jgi:2,3-dihydroxybenzoate decarboxylase
MDTLLEVGADRVLFSTDYPYETMQEQSDWFESLPISDGDRLKVGRSNAEQLLRLGLVTTAEQSRSVRAAS